MNDPPRTRQLNNESSPSEESNPSLQDLLEDQRQRDSENRPRPVETYIEEYPQLSKQPEVLLDLVYQEILLREQKGEAPRLEEYQERFPDLAEALQVQFEIDLALGQSLSTNTEIHAPSEDRGPDADAPLPSVFPHQEIPGYEILGELGRGGMGVVYKAKQTALNRVVALKMILGSGQAQLDVLARFRTEAEAIARLQHPNITQIYEVGQEPAPPFFSLEYCAGGSLHEKLLVELLTASEAASLVEALAHAMHAAHAVHVIHRDLKPANILLTSSGIPKITDFGLAKQLDDEGQTQSGAVMGTASYMAPEQARGEISEIAPTTDVYALGAILYECLTGRPPFKSANVMDTLLQVTNDPPVPPRQLNPKIPVDLETICLKCLEKEQARRYHSAEALAEDLHRFLQGDPIHARPSPWYERMSFWMRRHPAWTAILTVGMLATTVILGTWIWSYHQLATMNEELQQARDKAESRYRIALRSVDEMYVNVMEQWVSEDPHMDDLQRAFLEKALRVYKQLAEDQQDDPELQYSTAHAHFVMGQIHVLLGEYSQAEREYQKAIQRQRALVDRDPNETRYRHELANSYNWLGELHRKSSRDERALQLYDKALGHQRTLIRQNPDRPEYAREAARSLSNRGIIYRKTGKFELARQRYEEAIALLTPLVEQNPKQADSAHELAKVRINLGNLLADSQKDDPMSLALARDAYRKAIDTLERLADHYMRIPTYRFELAKANVNLTNLLRGGTTREEARRHCSQAVDLLANLHQSYPGRLQYRSELGNAYNTFAVLEVRDNPDLAKSSWEKAWNEFQWLANRVPENSSYHYRAGLARYNLGILAALQQQSDVALEHFENSLPYFLSASSRDAENVQYQKQALRAVQRIVREQLARKQDAQAAGAIRNFARTAGDSDRSLLECARLMAQCISLANRLGKGSAESAVRARAKDYTAQTLEYLDRISPSSLSPIPSLRDDPLFEPLVPNAKFQAILERWSSSSQQ